MNNNYYSGNSYGAPPPQQQGYGGYNAPPPQNQAQYGQQNYGAPPQQQWGANNSNYGNQQQGGYNAPPPQGQGQYGMQSNQYSALPPQGQYGGYQTNTSQFVPPPGGPPQSQYGAPPPNQYGAPPQNQYGAPPQNQYGAPHPVNQQYGALPPTQQFNQTPSSGGAPMFLGVPIPAPPPALPTTMLSGYNAQFDAERIRKATKGFGTDERVLIDTLSPLDAFQMDVLSRTYERTVGKSLKVTLEKELSSWLEYTLVLLSLGPLGGDVYLLNRACKGAGTHEDLLNEVLLGRTNQEIFMLKEAYQRTYHKDLVQVVRGELSMKTERMFNMALSGQRDETPFVNQQQVQQDVEALYRAGPGKMGTDEIGVCGILLSRSGPHLQAIAQQFPRRHRTSLSQMINSEFSGHMRDGLLYIAKGAENDGQGVARDVEYLEAAMAGMGTKDERMIYRIVRAHWNRPRFGAIKAQFENRYRTTLRRRVEGETTGKYEKALVGIIDQN